MSRFWSPLVGQLSPYVPGEQPRQNDLIKLNTNEHPYGPAPEVLEAIRAAVSADLRLYPEPSSMALRETVAAYYGLSPEQVFAGNGSDEVLGFVFAALLKHSHAPLLYPDLTYSFYPVYCRLYDIRAETVALTADFHIDIRDYRRPNSAIIFANPNAPTGRALRRDELRQLLFEQADSVVVVDEAYVDFGAESAVPLIDEFPNLLVVQTLSKSRALAGLRIGLAMGQRPLIEALERMKNSFNSYPLDRLAQAAGMAAFQAQEYFAHSIRRIIANREKLSTALQKRGWKVIPSQANFILAAPPQPANQVFASLRQKNIIVRHFSAPRIQNYLRISIGSESQCDALVRAVDEIVAQE